jgi:hypothetical protein
VTATTRSRLARLLWLSVAAAIATITLKTLAWALTGSVEVGPLGARDSSTRRRTLRMRRHRGHRQAAPVVQLGLSRRQLKWLRHAEPREVIEFGR